MESGGMKQRMSALLMKTSSDQSDTKTHSLRGTGEIKIPLLLAKWNKMHFFRIPILLLKGDNHKQVLRPYKTICLAVKGCVRNRERVGRKNLCHCCCS